MADQFLARVWSGPVICGDGAWGSLLIERGLPARSLPESWTLERPDVLREIAEEYLAAGAEVLTTNTFGASSIRLATHGLADRAEELNMRAVEVLTAVSNGRAWVNASMGPTGRLLKPLGDLDPAEASAAFEQQASALARAGADVISVETMTDLVEAELAVKAAKSAAPRLPVIATMTFEVSPRGVFTIMGVSASRAAQVLADAGADLVGANCGHGVQLMQVVVREFAAHARTPIAVRPNAGLPERRDGRLVYAEDPAMFATVARHLVLPGIALVGGCCGTTPAHIRLLSRQLAWLE
jgi:5-methyltetrahydrofolate--homocysteine methyltransferase